MSSEAARERAEAEARLSAANAAHAEALAAVQRDADRRVLETREAADKRLSDSLAHLTGVVDRMQKELAVSTEEAGMVLSAARTKHKAEVAELKAQHADEMERARATLAQTHADADRLFAQVRSQRG